MHSRTIKVDHLARVEGEGSLHLTVENGELSEVAFKIFEPPRFFEAFLRGRRFDEAPDITARICGICPVAYQMSACHAMEQALGITLDGQLRELRRLLYCGEWIASHALHVFLLHTPDFLGYASAIEMTTDYPEMLQNALLLKKTGNALMALIGGREVHPINVKVGGFYKLPTRAELLGVRDRLVAARALAEETIDFVSGFDFPAFDQAYEFVALRHPNEYPFNEGRIVSNRGLDIDIALFNDTFEERHAQRSNALHAVIRGRGSYFVGPMARYALNFDRLPAAVQQAAIDGGLTPVCRNPFKSIIVRAVEILYAVDEALRIVDQYQPSGSASIAVEPRAGTGHGCTEAPRGICYHRYEIQADGLIASAQIVPPTSQNQLTIENDLRHFAQSRLDLPDDKLQWQCEQAIRNYDPCISCATHFLDFSVERR